MANGSRRPLLTWACSSVLVLGYSWLDTHFPQLGNLGKGYQVAWRRVVLVLIGTFLAFHHILAYS